MGVCMIIIMKGMSKLPNVPSGRTTISTKYVDERTGEPTKNFPSGDTHAIQEEIAEIYIDLSDIRNNIDSINDGMYGYILTFQVTPLQIIELLSLNVGDSLSFGDIPLISKGRSFSSTIVIRSTDDFSIMYSASITINYNVEYEDAITSFGYTAFQYNSGTGLSTVVYQLLIDYDVPIDPERPCTHNFKITRIV